MRRSCLAWLAGVLPLLISCMFLAACLRQTEQQDATVEAFTAGSLVLPANSDVPQTIFIKITDPTDHTSLSTQDLETFLAEHGFTVVSSPSEAGYILHITLLQEGSLGPNVLANQVKAGFGADAAFSGTGYSGWLLDALLVQRLVPQDRRPSQTRLKNISSRNALASAKMRLGLQIEKELHGKKTYEKEFADALAREVGLAIVEARESQ